MKKKIPLIVITKLPRWIYFQWFLLGFYILKEKGMIDLKFKIDLITSLFRHQNTKCISGIGRRFLVKDS
jgi:hypothetical protein